MLTFITLCACVPASGQTAVDRLLSITSLRQEVEAFGGQVVSIYWTDGPYDVVLTTVWPAAATARAALPRLNALCAGPAETLQVKGPEEIHTALEHRTAPC